MSFNRTSMESKLQDSSSSSSPTSSFNRTSMESKQAINIRFPNILGNTFNRTSMESKHLELMPERDALHPLLIEPVWNRNIRIQPRMVRGPSNLLIEPVWNRNSNVLVNKEKCMRMKTFNRTSMESKRVSIPKAVRVLISF